MKELALLIVGACVGICGFLAAIMALSALEDTIRHIEFRERSAVLPPNWQKISSDESWSRRKTKGRRFFFLSL